MKLVKSEQTYIYDNQQEYKDHKEVMIPNGYIVYGLADDGTKVCATYKLKDTQTE